MLCVAATLSRIQAFHVTHYAFALQQTSVQLTNAFNTAAARLLQNIQTVGDDPRQAEDLMLAISKHPYSAQLYCQGTLDQRCRTHGLKQQTCICRIGVLYVQTENDSAGWTEWLLELVWQEEAESPSMSETPSSKLQSSCMAKPSRSGWICTVHYKCETHTVSS